jgi:hypothetical protein
MAIGSGMSPTKSPPAISAISASVEFASAAAGGACSRAG